MVPARVRKSGWIAQVFGMACRWQHSIPSGQEARQGRGGNLRIDRRVSPVALSQSWNRLTALGDNRDGATLRVDPMGPQVDS